MTAGEGVKKSVQRHVLIVGGDLDLRKTIGIKALSIGISPRYAVDGQEALSILESQPTDFIISDILMPNMNGLALLNEIRKRGSAIPFLVLSSHADKELVLAAYRLGILDYLEKPIDNSMLKFLMIEAVKLAVEIENADSARVLAAVEESKEGENEEKTLGSNIEEFVIEKLEKLDKRGEGSKVQTPASASSVRNKDPLSTFVNNALGHLKYTEQAVRGLHNEKCDWELGYLSRVMNELLTDLQPFRENELSSLVRALKQCFSLYRIRTSMLTHRELGIIKRAHKILMFKIASLLDKPKTVPGYPISEETVEVTSDLRKCVSL